MEIGLGAGGREVDLEPVGTDGNRAEALVGPGLAAQARRDLGRVALHDDVHVRPIPAQQQVSHGAADEVRRDSRRGLAQGLDSGQRVESLEEALGVDRMGCLTGRHRNAQTSSLP